MFFSRPIYGGKAVTVAQIVLGNRLRIDRHIRKGRFAANPEYRRDFFVHDRGKLAGDLHCLRIGRASNEACQKSMPCRRAIGKKGSIPDGAERTNS